MAYRRRARRGRKTSFGHRARKRVATRNTRRVKLPRTGGQIGYRM